MNTLTKAEKKNRFFASRGWYAAAFAIILWAILQEIVMASTDIVDNIFVNFLKDDQVHGLSELNQFIRDSGWDGLTKEQLTAAGLSTDYFGQLMHYSAGQIAVNGVTASNQMYIIMFAMVSGFCYGSGIYSAQFYGAKDYDRLRQITALKIYVVFLITAIFALLTIPGITEKAIGFTTEPKHAVKPSGELAANSTAQEIKDYFAYFQYRAASLSTEQGIMYYRIVAPTYLMLTVNEVAITSLRETRRPFYSFWMSVIALITNCIMNVFLTAPKFIPGFEGLGVRGTAIATAASRSLQLIFVTTLLSIKRFEFIPNLQSFKIKKPVLFQSLHKALPILFNELLFSFAAVIQVKLKGMYSVEALTANAMFATITMAFFSPLYHGLNAGITVFVGNELGANNLEQAKYNAKHLMRIGIGIGIIFGLALVGLSFVIPNLLFSNANQESKRIAIWMLFIYGLIYPAMMISNASYSTMRTGGAVWSAFLLDGAFNWTVEVPILALLILLNHNGTIHMDIVYIHLIVTSCEIIKAIWGYGLYSRKKWVNNLTIEKPTKKMPKIKMKTQLAQIEDEIQVYEEEHKDDKIVEK